MSNSYKYEIVIYWSESDRAFIAEVPELPGCAADGTTYAEALANVDVIIQEWIETAKETGATRNNRSHEKGVHTALPVNSVVRPFLVQARLSSRDRVL
jgi:predicted RNase H-like HicB family nuclease